MTQEYNCPECGRADYEGVCPGCKGRKKRERYQAMTQTEVAGMIEKIIVALHEYKVDFDGEEECEKFFRLLAYQGISTEKIAREAARAGVYSPCELYRDAPADVCEALIELLLNPDCDAARTAKRTGRDNVFYDSLLQCLAIAGGDRVLDVFQRLEKSPLPWAKRLHAPPSVYAMAGGWTFDKDGNRIELCHNTCFPVLRILGEGEVDNTVSVASPRAEVCSVCGSRLLDILTLNGRDERLLFLGMDGVVRIPICPVCTTLCGQTMVRYTPDGDSTMELVEYFGEREKISDEEYAIMTAKRFTLAKQPASLFFTHGCDECITIGGFANWTQDSQYNACPDCGKTMRYFASVPWLAFSDNIYVGGMLYLELCPDCRIISVLYQCT